MKLSAERILIAVLAIVLGMITWNWNTMANDVQRNEDRSVENSKAVAEIRVYQQQDGVRQEKMVELLEELVKQKREAGNAGTGTGGDPR